MRYLILIAITACHQAKTTEVLSVAITAWPAPLKPSCDLPPVPSPYLIVGFPVEQKIYVTASDLLGLVDYQAKLNAWAQDVAICLAKFTQP